MPKVLLVATLETKSEEVGFLRERLSFYGIEVGVLDASLGASGRVLSGDEKVAAMEHTVAKLRSALDVLRPSCAAVIGLGGGTGGELILRAMQGLPMQFPKVLVSTMPFDPRAAVADNSIIFVPTLSDMTGLNATLRECLDKAAALTAGLCQTRYVAPPVRSVGVTALGATEPAVGQLVTALRGRGKEVTVFHANGFGGAGYTRYAQEGRFDTLIDLTTHELTRLHLAGAHVPMPERFSCAPDLARIVLPGGVNFIGLGPLGDLGDDHKARPHYAHSGFFTHVQLSRDEMEQMAGLLAQSLNAHAGPAALIVPMGGFSHQDCDGGAIEAPGLRRVFLKTVSDQLDQSVTLRVLDAHLGAPETTEAILDILATFQTPAEASHA